MSRVRNRIIRGWRFKLNNYSNFSLQPRRENRRTDGRRFGAALLLRTCGRRILNLIKFLVLIYFYFFFLFNLRFTFLKIKKKKERGGRLAGSAGIAGLVPSQNCTLGDDRRDIRMRHSVQQILMTPCYCSVRA